MVSGVKPLSKFQTLMHSLSVHPLSVLGRKQFTMGPLLWGITDSNRGSLVCTDPASLIPFDIAPIHSFSA